MKYDPFRLIRIFERISIEAWSRELVRPRCDEICGWAELKRPTLQYWIDTGLVSPIRETRRRADKLGLEFTSQEARRIYVIAKLREADFSLQTIRRWASDGIIEKILQFRKGREDEQYLSFRSEPMGEEQSNWKSGSERSRRR